MAKAEGSASPPMVLDALQRLSKQAWGPELLSAI